MPGIFGQVGCTETLERQLRSGADAVWGGIEWIKRPAGLIGGHSHRGRAVWETGPETFIAVDGDAGLYEAPPDEARPPVAGNLLAVDFVTGDLSVHCDLSGAFPFFFGRAGGCLAFSSHQRVLAGALRSTTPDLTGCIEAARFGGTLAGRSCHEGIARLLPGQRLVLRSSGRLDIEETSTLWSDSIHLTDEDAADEAWDALRHATHGATPMTGEVALMMSAGWDSRTLLAVLQHAGLGDRLRGFTHGDLESREIGIAKAIARSRGLRHHTEPIDDRVLSDPLADESFARTECLIFPHWHRAGALLAQMGVVCAVSGVFGAVIGGHYGPSSVMPSGSKMRHVLQHLVGKQHKGLRDRRDVEALLKIGDRSLPWYLGPDLMSPEEYCVRINRDIVASLDRLEARGVHHPDQLLEAFLVESRGAQYMNGQNLSLRAFIDVVNPFCGEDALRLASSLSMHAKIHNRLNRIILLRHAPDLTRFPLAATLVAANRPILAQEASRLVRKTWETVRQHAPSSLGGGVRPRLGWVDFDFMKGSEAVHRLFSSMRAELWNQAALQSHVRWLHEMPKAKNAHPTFDQLGKLLTVDRLVIVTA